jgi:MFS family permease
MIFQVIVTALLFAAVLMQFAVDRAPDITESHDNKAARRVLIAGLFVLSVYMAYTCWLGLAPHVLPLIGILFVALAEIAFCVNRLFPTVFVTLQAHHGHRPAKR